MQDDGARQAVIATALEMNRLGLNQGTSGNVSCRAAAGGLLITPSGRPYETLEPADLLRIGFDGTVLEGKGRPSTEWRIHADILAARPEAGAVVHCHAMFCTTLSCLRRPIPAVHYMIAVAGGDSIRCADYATFGTPELSQAALAALADRKACLLANHGMIAIGTELRKALALAVEVETLAAQYWRAVQVGEPVILPADEMTRVLEKFRDYGA
ncbi:MAG: class II aldolase [Alphaproteobacteria bacterium]|jgi:L-fuculose-phosphate aldolase|nr:class II aldolase [Alphaproteobacteria bacterium]